MENATATAKHYKTTAKQYKSNNKVSNNNTRLADKRAATTATSGINNTTSATTATATKKQTYRSSVEPATAATTAQKQTHSKANSKTTGAATTAESATIVSGGNNNKPSTTSATESKAQQKSLAADNSNNSSNNNNKQHSDNSISENYEFRSRDKTQAKNISDSKMTLQHVASAASVAAATREPKASDAVTVGNSISATTATTTDEANTAVMAAAAADWTNSRYLHKKFKRLASTTETETSGIAGDITAAAAAVAAATTLQRTTSLSPSSSLSPPPTTPAPNAAQILTNGHHHQQQQQQQKQHEQQQPLLQQSQQQQQQSTNAEFSANLLNNNVHAYVQQPQQQQHPAEQAIPINAMESNNNNNTSGTHIHNNKAANAVRTPLNSNYAPNSSVSPATFAQHQQQTQPTITTATAPPVPIGAIVGNGGTGRYACPFCNLNCAKPSVLQKHIRAHTNERPYPCDTCGIAFKTKSNLYKHCRSRSHAARTRGFEVPADADDGLSDQDVDAELSNSSSELQISRSGSPYDEAVASPTPSPSTLSAAKSTYMQQSMPQHIQQLPLGSPAAGTLPPATATNNAAAAHDQLHSATAQHRQSIDYKPYKPKFHNASLYAPGTTKEQQQQHSATLEAAQHQLQKLPTALSIAAATQHLPHPTLSPSTHLKLNNHINSHQLQLQLQHQTLLMPASPVVLPPPTPAALSVGGAAYYMGLPYSVSSFPPKQPYYTPAMHPQVFALQLQHMQVQQQQQQQHQQQQQQLHSPLLKTPPAPQVQSRPVNSQAQPTVATSLPQAAPVAIGGREQQQQQPPPPSQQQQHYLPAPLSVAPPTPPTANLGSFASGMQVNVEKVQEHISKLISQNEAIVENKEILLQKKYPKQLNRSRSFNNANNTSNTSGNTTNNNISASNANSLNHAGAAAGDTKVNLAQAIVQKQQLQQQQQYQMYFQQQQQQQQQLRLDEAQHALSHNGLVKRSNSSIAYASSKPAALPAPPPPTPTKPQQQSLPPPMPVQTLQYRQDPAVSITKAELQSTSGNNNNMPLNLSAKAKPAVALQSQPQPQQPSNANHAPKKRQSIDQQLQPNVTFNATAVAAPGGKIMPPNNSIIKNLLLNARGLAVPIGEGDDAVYSCPICASEFRSADELKLHNSIYCQDASSSAPMSPASTPSTIYLSLPELKSHMANSKNPLSLAKLAWSQLKIKPSSLVLSRLSAVQSPTRTTTVTAPSPSSTTSVSVGATTAMPVSVNVVVAPSIDANALRFVDAPLPSPGPLLGKTPLVDYAQQSTPRKEDVVVITKMHEDRHFSGLDSQPSNAKRPRNISDNSFSYASGMPLLNTSTELHGAFMAASNELPSKKEERLRRFTSSGGSMIPISECTDLDKSPKMIRTPLLSGGSFQEVSPKQNDAKERKSANDILSKLPSNGSNSFLNSQQHFQFPPINSITAFNPLTLPPISSTTSIGSDKAIPYVPGIPGPGSLTPQLPPLLPPPQQLQLAVPSRGRSPNRKQPSPLLNNAMAAGDLKALSPFGGVQNLPSEFSRIPPTPAQRSALQWNSKVINNNTPEVSKKPFNYLRIADNVSPRKRGSSPMKGSPPEQEVRHFNFDNINKTNETTKLPEQAHVLTPLHVDTPTPAAAVPVTGVEESVSASELKSKNKFLRPTSLPLKPGTFTPKRHHGITPTANTLPLISPETPRPSKSCVQLYLNGHAYTYLGLKCSTKMFYCTVNCPQPSYVAGMHKLSMYSVWQVCEENNPHPLGFKPKHVMALYDSRPKLNASFTMAGNAKLHYALVNMQQTVCSTSFPSNQHKLYQQQLNQLAAVAAPPPKALNEANLEVKAGEESASGKKAVDGAGAQLLVGGYESHEDYTYIRGRGRGRYVCSECGIRCKKPSMLKKHIRTHTDVRPFTCSHCNFSFKTKGNLTKHMQSKTHFKKCYELGIMSGPMPADSEFSEADLEFDQQSSTSAGGRTSSMAGETDSDDYSDNESESSDTDESKSRLKEHEAARGLLSLSMTPPIPQSVSPYPPTNEAPAPAASPANSIGSSAGSSVAGGSQPKRLVCSFTSPKPPFDYQKQEQYYSNPEESKPKRSSTIAGLTSDESAPMDLTKPRPAVSTSQATAAELPPSLSVAKSQAQQMRDVIFGNEGNECGFMKTLISVSDKVRISAEMEEKAKHESENVLLQTYLKEQALQHAKMKQSQYSRSYVLEAPTPKTNNVLVSMANSMAITSSTNSSSGSLISSVIIKQNPETSKPMPELPTIEVHEVKTPEPATPIVEPSVVAPNKSNDESEESESQSDQELGAVSSKNSKAIVTTEAPHNANLPAAVQQPDAKDFSGVLTNTPTITVIVGEDGFKNASSKNPDVQNVAFGRGGPPPPPIAGDARPTCTICSKTFQRQHQLTLHMNIHYMERKFKCEPCSISFRTQGHLQKHERSEAHKNKVMMTSTFGVPTTSNPRPFECTDCKIAFRIHGHLAKHLRSKTHVQKLECLQKLPFGTYAEIERAGISLTEIDTSDCENSLISLKLLAQKLLEKDPNKLSSYTTPSGMVQLAQDAASSSLAIGSQDSASEDGFSAANSAAASAIASLDNDSAGNTPQRANSMSEDESLGNGNALTNSLKRRLPSSFSSNGDESDNAPEREANEKRPRSDLLVPTGPAAASAAAAAAASN
ncbi:uncharacterized protein LOC115619944 isoform X2 [Scaptodrosophila lebanonensis]|nr:uncharacterized protein LOC115619944 isoform X2 [Scaptodrosophila lebanonensis]XP_030368833.1 uncharacterized protein LOC115619944 isoform X2 [Scaptodrosophila lebanonensis]